MEIFTRVAPPALSEIGKWVWSIAASKINYLLCYGREVEKLRHIVQELDRKKKDIQQKVDAAQRNGRIVGEQVTQWLINLNDIEKDAGRLEEQVKGVRRFMMGCCWNCFSSYEIGEEAAEKIATANKLLSTIITIYSHEPSLPSPASIYRNRVFQESLPTKLAMDHIWKALNIESSNIIGVYGMGGVGKTTIMNKIIKDAKKVGQYNEVIMVTVSQIQDVKKMQSEIAEKLGLKLTYEDEGVRGAKILERIKGASKILIILDDLWGYLDISKIGIPSAEENKECKVVITTRRIDVCNSMKCKEKINVKPLSPEESWDLFKLEVGDVLEKTDNLTEVARDVANECAGLPLAIITLGRAMRDKDDISTWNSVRTELQKCIQTDIDGMKDSVFICIRRSFDFLRSDVAKLCFLLCSLFPEDWEIDIIHFYRYVVGEGILPNHDYSMEEAWNKVCRLLDELKDCCLLLEGKDSEHFKMHDVVRDVAIWISSTDETYGFCGFAKKGLRGWPEIEKVDKCKRICFMGNSFDSLPEQPVFPNLRTMILRETQISTIPDRFFGRMEELLVLDLRSSKVASLPSSLRCLVKLKALFLSRSRWVKFDVTSLSLIGELKKLEILQLEGFEFGTVPKEFGNLTSLRCLDLLRCRGTIPRNLISRLSRSLEQLYLTKVFSNWQVEDGSSSSSSAGCAATFAELARLSCLTTLHVDIKNADIFLQQQHLNVVPWPALTDFYIVIGDKPLAPLFYVLSRSRRKDLAITKSTYIYKWVIDLVTKTERLWLHNWSGMECLIGGAEEGFSDVGHKLFEVKQLILQSMPDMKSLCTGTLQNDIILRKLSSLVIEDCHKLIDVLPTCMLLRTHQLMERLVIESCDKLERVLSLNFAQEEEEEEGQSAAGIVLLPRLEDIYLRDLPELKSVWGDDGVIMLPAGSLQNLQRLYISGCKSLKDDHILPPILPIPNKLENFPCLRELEIHGCVSLTYLLSWRQAKGLPHLQTLYVSDCERMETLIKAAATDEEEEDDKSLASAVQLLPQLDSIQLYNLPMLTNICEYMVNFPSLRVLYIIGCDSLTYLLWWRRAKGLPHLQTLYVSDCERMETVIKEEEEEEGGATDDDHNKEEEERDHVLPSLTRLDLSRLPMLRSFFQGGKQCSEPVVLSTFKSLKGLYVKKCPKLKKLPLSSSSPVLESLWGDSWEWFESLEWGEDESIKERLRPVFQCEDKSDEAKDESDEEESNGDKTGGDKKDEDESDGDKSGEDESAAAAAMV